MNIYKLGARASVSLIAIAAVAPAFAQSTSTQDFEQQIIVTGTRTMQGIGGIANPITPKSKATLGSQFIQHETPGQSINDVINFLPGVSFQNNDPYGSAGGTLTIRGFDASRISETWDGFPLNDTGNYALYSNQQLDPELIDHVTVSLGSTDVDSPSAAATGSTVNYVTRNPTDDFHIQMAGSVGEYDYFRVFGVVDTGVFTPFGTKAFISASKSTNTNVFNDFGNIDKTQINAKIYQPIGSNGDFVSLAGHYNRNINNFFGSVPLTNVSLARGGNGGVGTGSGNIFPQTRDERFYDVANCVSAGASGSPCGFTAYDYRFNPSRTANIRFNSRFTLADKLVLTADVAYQYTLANGGGTATAREGYNVVAGQRLAGYFGSTPYLGGVDLNGNGTTGVTAGNPGGDSVLVSAPSTTNTNRVIANIGLRYDFSEGQTVRVGYSFDYGHHRQTGEITTIRPDGFASNPFANKDPIFDSTGRALQKRDRNSYAILNQAFGEYRGQFLDNRLTVLAGVRAPFFKRDLQNYCFTTSTGGAVTCSGQNAATDAIIAPANPYSYNAATNTVTGYAPPQKRNLNFNKVLPSAGLIFDLTDALSVFGNYSKGLQVPGTDNLYNAFYFPKNSPGGKGAKPETTDNFDAGLRFKNSQFQAQISGWYTIFHDRLASSYDLETNTTIYRNLGKVDKYGVDADVSYHPIPELTFYAFGSYLKSKIKDNVEFGSCSAANVAANLSAGVGTCTSVGQAIYALTKGQRESGSPVYTFGGRIEGHKGPLTLGIEAKRTGPRYINDQNLAVELCNGTITATSCSGTETKLFGAKAPAYTTVNLDARLAMGWAGLNDRTWLQLNVTNLFDKLYVGGIGTTTQNLISTTGSNLTYAQIGAPRAISGTINIGF